MILVNDAGNFGSAYWPLLHSKWNGCTPTDIVFPTFLFIIGITTVISTSSRLARGIPKQQLFLQIVRRTIILFLLGIVVNSFPFFNPHTMRFFGILPRISVCYFVVATLYLFSQGWRDKLALFIAILIGYWILAALCARPRLRRPHPRRSFHGPAAQPRLLGRPQLVLRAPICPTAPTTSPVSAALCPPSRLRCSAS